ncbi:hypothetical protein FS837_011635 [Tulasnella sp. UAMH 9824]|nr:hypothetical protein FS837_011635 [Tulasnella sp. UAMH 9824]
MVMYYPGSFVRSSSETNDAANTDVQPAATLPMPPWTKPVPNYDQLPRSLYPPPRLYYARARSGVMLSSSSSTNTETDTVMSDVQNYDDEGEDVDGTPLDAATLANYEVASCTNANSRFEGGNVDSDNGNQDSSSPFEADYEDEEEALRTVRVTRALSLKGRKTHATKAGQAANKRASPKRTTKAGKTTTSEKALATGGSASAGPARRTRSSTSSQQPKEQVLGYQGVDLSPLTAKGYKTRKIWPPASKATLRTAIDRWWMAEGAASYNYPRKIVIPGGKNEAWMYIWAECKKLNPAFNHNK